MSSILVTSGNIQALLLSVVTSTFLFFRRVLVLNRLEKECHVIYVTTWCLSVLSGCLFWLTLNTLDRGVLLQLTAGITSTVIAWLVYVLLVNRSLRLPTRQQWLSLSFHVVTEALVLLQVRLVLNNDSGQSEG